MTSRQLSLGRANFAVGLALSTWENPLSSLRTYTLTAVSAFGRWEFRKTPLFRASNEYRMLSLLFLAPREQSWGTPKKLSAQCFVQCTRWELKPVC